MHQAGRRPDRASDDVDPLPRADTRPSGVGPIPRLVARLGTVRSRSAVTIAVLGLGLAMVAAACGTDAGPTDTVAPDGGTPTAAATPAPSAAPPESPGTEPSGEPSPEPTDEPTDEPTVEPGSTPVMDGDDAAGCSGNPGNQDFFRAVSEAVQWPVYCAVLPGGWTVGAGTYSLAGAGQLEISYQGPGGRRFELLEGAFCASGDGCVPGGSDLGPAAFGDREGTLIATGSDSWVIVVDPGSSVAWQAIGTSMSEEELRQLAADLLRLTS